MNELTGDQILLDIIKLAKQEANERGITNPTEIGYIMDGIRIGMARGLEIAKNIYSPVGEELKKITEEEIPF